MITPETITTAKVISVFHALATATEKARRVMRLAEDSDITPEAASERINSIITNLNDELARDSKP